MNFCSLFQIPPHPSWHYLRRDIAQKLGIPTPRRERPRQLKNRGWTLACKETPGLPVARRPFHDETQISSARGALTEALQSEGDAAEGADASSPGDPEAEASRLRNGPLGAIEVATEAVARSEVVLHTDDSSPRIEHIK